MRDRRSPWRFLSTALVAALVTCATSAMAQDPLPLITISDASVFEGNSGTRTLVFTLFLSAPSSTPVTGEVVVQTLVDGPGVARGGASCNGDTGPDFEEPATVPFTIPAKVTSTALEVTVCGDTREEPDEILSLIVRLENLSGAECVRSGDGGRGSILVFCPFAIGTIRNDDGPVSVAINDITVFEGLGTGTRTGTFTVNVSHPSPTATSVNFATRNGTAVGATSCGPFLSGFRPDYVTHSGTLTIPPNTLSASIPISICNDGLSGEPDQTFFVDLSAPSPAGVTITDGVGRATIRELGFVGEFTVDPTDASARVGQPVTYTVAWTVPEGEVWRDLKTIDVRLRGGKTALWVRWDEQSNTFRLCRHGKGSEGDGDDDQEKHRGGVRCGPAAAPGEGVVLETSLARLHLAQTAVIGSGPTGSNVTLQLAITFKPKAEGHTYNVEVAATDDFGRRDAFRHAGAVDVESAVVLR